MSAVSHESRKDLRNKVWEWNSIGATACRAWLRAESFNSVQNVLGKVYMPGFKTIWTYLVLPQQILTTNELKKKKFKLLAAKQRRHNWGLKLWWLKNQPTYFPYLLRESGICIVFQFWEIWVPKWEKFRHFSSIFRPKKQSKTWH